MKNARESLKELANYAKDRGVKLLLESVNRFELLPDLCLINKQREAVQLVEEIDADSMGIVLDTFHCSIEETDVVDAIVRFSKHIKEVHICDSNRSIPGSGNLEFKRILQSLKTQDYRGYLSFEPIPKPSKEQLRDSYQYLKSMEPFLE